MKPGAWLIVAGGWNVQQFKEKRLPTQAELVAAAPNNPVYVQLGYGWVVMTPAGLQGARTSRSEADLPPGGRFEKDADGKPTGAITGGQGAIIALFDRLPKPIAGTTGRGHEEILPRTQSSRADGLRRSRRQQSLARPTIQPLFKVWRDGEMTVRVALRLNGQTSGSEFDEYQSLTRCCRWASATTC